MSTSFIPPSSQPKAELEDAVIELAYAGAALTSHVVFQVSPGQYECFCCGTRSEDAKNPANHKSHCAVARVFSAIEATRKAAGQ